MNGNWNFWGQQPTRFVALWRRVHDAIKDEAPQTAMVWAPSSGNGCISFSNLDPYGGPIGGVISDADMDLLDTNNNGRLDSGDDAYLPYYPGDSYVDWVGTSIYHYGAQWPWEDNVLPVPGKFEEFLNTGDFYQDYAVAKDKPFMVAETSSTFHVEQSVGPGELAIKQAWWQQFITNGTFLDAHPNIKLICLFEFQKVEETTLRDWRFTTKSRILDAFKEDYEAVKDRYIDASTISAGSNNEKTGSASPLPDVENSSVSIRISGIILVFLVFFI